MPREEKTEKKERYTVGEIATETQPVIVDGEQEEQLTISNALARVLNELDSIKNKIM